MAWLLDLLYPPQCGLCARIQRPAICEDCLEEFPEAITEVRLFAPTDFLKAAHCLYIYEGRAAQAVKRLKYERATSLVEPMTRMMKELALKRGLLDADLIAPVPIHWSRQSDRGFNQADLLARTLKPSIYHPKLLQRIRKTPPQAELDGMERRKNLQGAFLSSDLARGQRVLLVDDVITSGGTAHACAAALHKAGAAQVEILTFCGEQPQPEPDQSSGDRSP